MKRIWIPQVVTSVMLFWALNPDNPYGYYILLRWVYCAAFVYLTIHALAQEKQVGSGFSALLRWFTIPSSEFT